ncbi:hypothetical protein H8356DRAFT_1328777 [Neocallimastix lanati (nom. inval.)]|nr:hypothetical protein H8356DRAFT_1328777 [Neocallimastix sp. JGI-2020a]
MLLPFGANLNNQECLNDEYCNYKGYCSKTNTYCQSDCYILRISNGYNFQWILYPPKETTIQPMQNSGYLKPCKKKLMIKYGPAWDRNFIQCRNSK